MFSFTPKSTVRERTRIRDSLVLQIDAKLNKAIAKGESLNSRTQSIRNARGKVVATSNFVDLNSDYMVANGLTDPENPWMWKGQTFKDEVYPVEVVA